MAAALTLLPLTAAHAVALHRLDQRCFAAGIAYSLAEMRAILATPRGYHVGYAGTGEALAAFILTLRRGASGHIVTVDVAPEHRRQGFGLALMRAAGKHWRAQGARNLRLEVAVNNAGALAFYGRLGFQVVRALPGYYARDLDGLEMVKELGR